MTLATFTPEEHLVRWTMRGTFVLYLVGGLYPYLPALGWLLAAMTALRWIGERALGTVRQPIRVPAVQWVWVGAMGVMLIALLVAHDQMNLGYGKTIKSSIGWAKGWALLALFPLAGCLRIRPRVLYRGACELGAQSLVLLPLCLIAAFAGLPEVLWVSPTSAVGGPGPEFFETRLYSIDPGSGRFRFWLHTPWAPALGFVGNLYLILALRERHTMWRVLGIAGSIAMIVASGSRLALIAIPFVHGTTWALGRLSDPKRWLLAAPLVLALGVFAGPLQETATSAKEEFHAARAESSFVRAALGRIALERWRNEAPLFGHGIVESGPHLVEFMPIGSHHTWFGLFFVKGAVGVAALALCLAASAVVLLVKAQSSATARSGLAVLLTLFAYSFGENLEILAYLLWPGLTLMGVALALRHPAERTTRREAPVAV